MSFASVLDVNHVFVNTMSRMTKAIETATSIFSANTIAAYLK